MSAKRSAVLLAALCVLGAVPAPAGAQSIFAVNFLGEHRLAGSARTRALGLSAFAVRDSAYAIAANEAALADLPRVTFSLFESFTSSNVRSGSASADINRFQLPTVMIGVPLRRGLVFAAGYRQRFESKGEFSYPRAVPDGSTGVEFYKHRGSLFVVPLTFAWRAAPWASVAGSFNIERGAVSDISTVIFRIAQFSDVESRRDRSYSGTSYAASILLEPHSRVSIGAGWQSAIAYDVAETFAYTRSALDSSASWDFRLPMSWGAGAAAGVTERWWFSAYYWQREAPDPAGYRQLEGSIGDERFVSLGIERRRSSAGGFFERAPIRLGFYQDTWHFEYPAGRSVLSRFFTIGSGFGLPGAGGAVDISVEFGQIGSIGQNGVDERVFRLAMSLSAAESWSRRREER